MEGIQVGSVGQVRDGEQAAAQVQTSSGEEEGSEGPNGNV